MNKFIKKIQSLSLIILTALGLIINACTDEEETITPEVKLSKTEFSFPNSGGSDILYIQTNIPLEVTSDDESWCTLTKENNTSTKIIQYTITTTSNDIAEPRQTNINISGLDFSTVVLIKQSSAYYINITNTEKKYDSNSNGGEFTVKVETNGDFSINSNEVWVSQTEKTDSTVKFSVATNLGASRTATLTFTCGDESDEFIVNQLAGSNVIGGNTAMEIAHSLGLGWNLGNQLDAINNDIANETAWGNPATTQDAFYRIAASGIRSVRIPVTWLGHIGDAPNFTIDAAWLNRVAEVVGYAETAGLNAIVNFHHDGANSAYWLDIKNAALSDSVNDKIKAQLTAMWTQIANKFINKGKFLIFESMNEIHDGKWGYGANLTDGGKQYAVLNEWNQIFVNAVRATGGENNDRYLGVPGYVTNPDLTINHFILPTDVVSNRLMVSVHYYDPFDYTLENIFTEWGHTAANDKKDSNGDESYMTEIFGKLKTKFVDNGIPVYLGEIGSVHRSTERAEMFRKYYLEYLCKAAKTYGLAPFYWDNGSTGVGKECLGLLNHSTGIYINNGKDIIDIMANAIDNNDPSYTLNTVYNGAPQ
ncbi:MAG: cellulase family glycosylhydrolase [Marinilabiliaceae bacterium]|nr:cellulase family glycosylhydrolase [Marinilabiliaceae bacterium]